MAYKVSVITPFFNVEKEVFTKAFHSVMNQTIGFDSIEFIIVLHNCVGKYSSYVYELADVYPNAKFRIIRDHINMILMML